MHETYPAESGETDDLKVARFYALGGAGMHQWLGVTPGVPHPNPEELAQAANDTVAYLLSRPTGPWDEPPPDGHYESTLEDTSLKKKTARVLVDEWAEAELREDQTAAKDIFEELADRAMRRAKLVKHRRAVARDHDAASTLNTLYERKERIKAGLAPEPEPEPPPPGIVEIVRMEPEPGPTEKREGDEEPEAEPEERPPPEPPPVMPPLVIPAQKPPPGPSPAEATADTRTAEEVMADIWPKRRPKAARRNPLSRWWWAAAGAFGAWLSDPEKGRRRQAALTLGMFASAAALAWLCGHEPNENGGTETIDIPPPETPVAPPPDLNASYTDNLRPENYEGQRYEWGAAANDYGAANATPRLLEMIDDARAQGAEVNTWGDTSSGRWGITDVTIHYPGGTQKSYYDTPHKLALLQYLSRLNRLEEDDDPPPG